jgi:PAS domain S-box-containing protein
MEHFLLLGDCLALLSCLLADPLALLLRPLVETAVFPLLSLAGTRMTGAGLSAPETVHLQGAGASVNLLYPGLLVLLSVLVLGSTRMQSEAPVLSGEDLLSLERPGEGHPAASEAAEQRYYDLIQGLDAIVWEASLQKSSDTGASPLRFTFVSEQAERLLGYPARLWLADPGFWTGLIHPEDRERVLALRAEKLLAGEDHGLDYRVIAGDGRVVWLRDRARVVLDAEGKPRAWRGLILDISERRQAEEERIQLLRREQSARAQAETARQHLAFLVEASSALASSLDYETTLERVAGLAVPMLADWCVVHVVEEDRSIRQVALAHADPLKERLLRTIAQRYPFDLNAPCGAAKALRTGQYEISTEAPPCRATASARDAEYLELREGLGTRSYLCVPLVARSRTLGAITFLYAESGRRYSDGDLTLAEELGSRAALAIDNARLYQQRSEIARTLQQSLLPPQLPEIPGIELAECYRPAGEEIDVGGDFYDLFETKDHSWAITMGDFSGKGTPAAAVTGLARHTLRAVAMHEKAPSQILASLNEAILRQRPGEEYCTVAYLRLEPAAAGARVTLASGGHPLPLLLRADGRVERMGEPGMLLGVFPDPYLTDQVTDLQPGDAVILYTDGVTEARAGGELFGEARLIALLETCAGLDAPAIVERIEGAVIEYQGGIARDDLAILAMRIVGEAVVSG